MCDFIGAVGVTVQPDAVTMLHNAAGEAFVTLESAAQQNEVLKANRQQVGKRYVEVFQSNGGEKQAACERNRATMRDDAGYRGVLRMRGLPFNTTAEEVLEFFGHSESLAREHVHLMRRSDGRASGDAYAVFDSEEAAVAALAYDKQKLGSRWVDLFQSSKGELYSLTSVGGIMLDVNGSGGANGVATGGPGANGGANGEPEPMALGDGFFVVKLRGLPWNVTVDDIVGFLAPVAVPPGGVHLMNGNNGRPSGLAYVELSAEDDQKCVLEKDKQNIGGRYIDIFACSQNELKARLAGGLERGWHHNGMRMGANGMQMGPGGGMGPAADDATFVKLRGLPYSADQVQIAAFFAPLPIVGLQIALNNSGQPSGFGFVQFRSADDVAVALQRSSQVMGSRYVEVFRSTRGEMEQVVMPLPVSHLSPLTSLWSLTSLDLSHQCSPPSSLYPSLVLPQARGHAMAMRPPGGPMHPGMHPGHPGMQHPYAHHPGHPGAHPGHHPGYGRGGGGGHGDQMGEHHGGGRGGRDRGGGHGEGAYAAYQAAMQTLSCRPPPGYGHAGVDPAAYGTAPGYGAAPPGYGAPPDAAGYASAPPGAHGGYGAPQGYGHPPQGGAAAAYAAGAAGAAGYGGAQAYGYEQWGYYAQ